MKLKTVNSLIDELKSDMPGAQIKTQLQSQQQIHQHQPHQQLQQPQTVINTTYKLLSPPVTTYTPQRSLEPNDSTKSIDPDPTLFIYVNSNARNQLTLNQGYPNQHASNPSSFINFNQNTKLMEPTTTNDPKLLQNNQQQKYQLNTTNSMKSLNYVSFKLDNNNSSNKPTSSSTSSSSTTNAANTTNTSGFINHAFTINNQTPKVIRQNSMTPVSLVASSTCLPSSSASSSASSSTISASDFINQIHLQASPVKSSFLPEETESISANS